MPVILPPESEELWLDMGIGDEEAAHAGFHACPSTPNDALDAYEVSTLVNYAKK